MKHVGRKQNETLRRRLALVLRRLRAIKRERMPFNEVLQQLSAIQKQFGETLRYVNITLRDQDGDGNRPAFTFRVDKPKFRKATEDAAPDAGFAPSVPGALAARGRAVI